MWSIKAAVDMAPSVSAFFTVQAAGGAKNDHQATGDSAGPTLLGAEAALRVVAQQLPRIVPNMLINKRDGV